MKLRPYQWEIKEAIIAALKAGKRSILIVSPTGSGKTVLFTDIANGAGLKGKRVWILVHRQELVDQTSRTMKAFGVEHGCIAAGWVENPLPHVQIVSVQTVGRRLDRLKKPDVIIIDECHHAAAGTWKKILEFFPAAVRLGFTATPERLDGKGLSTHFEVLIRGPEVEWLIANGFLTKPKYFAPPIKFSLDNVGEVGGDYQKDQLAAALDRPSITGDAVTHYRQLIPGAPAVAFCASVEHAKHVEEAFNKEGFRAATLDGSLDKITRRKMVADLGTGELQILTSCEIISEGFDIPAIVGAILLRPTKSLGMHLQQIGRVLRPIYAAGYDLDELQARLTAMELGGKPFSFIIDHVGNCLRHGLAEEKREWSLEGRKKRKKKTDEEAVNVKQCPKCYACHEPAPICPECGHVYVIKGRPELEQVEGELVQIATAWDREPNAEEIARDRLVLEQISAARGYGPGWVDEVIACRIKNKITAEIDTSETILNWKGEKPKLSTDELRREQAAAKTYDELVALARSRGYSNVHFWARTILQSRPKTNPEPAENSGSFLDAVNNSINAQITANDSPASNFFVL